MRRIVLFEDEAVIQFSPIALLRPVFELLCGHFSLRERLMEMLPETEWGALIRPELAETVAESHPEAGINYPNWWNASETMWVNGRCLVNPQLFTQLEVGTAAWIGETLAAVHLPAGAAISGDREAGVRQLLELAEKAPRIEWPGTVLNYPWDLISENPRWLSFDFRNRTFPVDHCQLGEHIAVVGNRDSVFVEKTARIDPYVVIDTTMGPVWIAAGVRVQAFTRIEGPSYVGPGTQLFRANIREGCSIGPICRVGGEVEESILHGYVNKYHDGFLGHSYICPWVNLGALTSNSDLKNDYSPVSVPLRGESVKSGSTKVGCFIGDHTKTAIGTLFNTGTSVGVMSLVLPGGELLPKFIPSFSRVWHGRIEPLPDGCETALKTAELALGRRNETLTPAAEKLIRSVHAATEAERRSLAAR